MRPEKVHVLWYCIPHLLLKLHWFPGLCFAPAMSNTSPGISLGTVPVFCAHQVPVFLSLGIVLGYEPVFLSLCLTPLSWAPDYTLWLHLCTFPLTSPLLAPFFPTFRCFLALSGSLSWGYMLLGILLLIYSSICCSFQDRFQRIPSYATILPPPWTFLSWRHLLKRVYVYIPSSSPPLPAFLYMTNIF